MDRFLHLISLGCTKNLVDSEVMLGKLSEYKLTDDPSHADVIIINTCGFIEAAKQESLNTIFELHGKRKENSVLAICGCLSERYKDELQSEISEVDVFTGVGDYDKIVELIDERLSRFSSKVYLLKDEKRVIVGSNYHAYIKMAEGCNQKCSFCAIPAFKGKLQSRTIKEISHESLSLANDGYYDQSFISQDSSSYLRDFGEKHGLIDLIDEIEKDSQLKSARILYLYPSTTSDELLHRINASSLFHNYFDIPIQHISDKMLKIMKRGSGEKRLREILSLMKSFDNSFVRTSVIVGHPGESDEDFDKMCTFLKEYEFDRVNIFAYSHEEGTTAYEMEQIPQKVITKRIKKLEKIVSKTTVKSLKKDLGKIVKVVLQGKSSEGEFFYGAKKLSWAEDIDGEILINDSEIKDLEVGNIYLAKMEDVVAGRLMGKIINKGMI
jgi:ribosomal protein S12 methylthiotransferase RimO